MRAQVIRRIDVPPRDIRWADSGELVALISEASFYVLRFNRGAVEAALEAGAELDEDGIDDAFSMETETSEAVRTGAGPPRVGSIRGRQRRVWGKCIEDAFFHGGRDNCGPGALVRGPLWLG